MYNKRQKLCNTSTVIAVKQFYEMQLKMIRLNLHCTMQTRCIITYNSKQFCSPQHTHTHIVYGNRLTLQEFGLIQYFSFFLFSCTTTTIQNIHLPPRTVHIRSSGMLSWLAGFRSSNLPTGEKQCCGNLRFHGCNFFNLTRLYD